ncbi:MAG: ROK family transcriptional regulator [Solirubrobacteraceae bacterium]
MDGPDGQGALRALRQRNRAQIIEVLRNAGTASRAEIARLTGLSRTTVSSVVAELNDSGLIAETPTPADAPAAGRGRPGVLLSLQPSAGAAVGIDFGHTHLRVAIADLSSRVLAEHHRRLDVDRAADVALDAAVEMLDEVLEESGTARGRIAGVGVGLPGPLDRASGTVGSAVILPGWAGLQPAAELERRLALPIMVDNDANLGALAENAVGAGRGFSDIVYLKLSSGIGAGLILGGRLHHGATGMAGEIGHVLSNPDGLVCRCGNRGCLETVAAGPALLDLLRVSHGESLDTADLLRLASEGDVGVRRVFADAGRSLGRALADLVNAVNPGRIVVGGELSEVGDPLLDGIRTSIDRYALPAAAAALEVVPGVLGDRAEVLGAVALVISDTGRLSSGHLSAV